ncbi:hypothetical protein [Streptosporangium sp. NPDC003464]
MTDSSGSSGATPSGSSGANPYGAYGLPNANTKPGVVDPRMMDPGFKMEHDRVIGLGDSMGKRAPVMTELSGRTRAIDMHVLTFGVIGGGLNVAHREVRDSAADALTKAKDVLESWKKALDGVVANAKEAHKASSAAPPEEKGGPELPTGGIKPAKFDPKDLGDPKFGDLPKSPSEDDLLKPLDDLKKPPYDDGLDDLKKPPYDDGLDDLKKPPYDDGLDDLKKPPYDDDLPKPPSEDDLPKPPGAGDLPKTPNFDDGTQGRNGLDDPLKTQLAGYDPKQSIADALANTPRTPNISDLRAPGTDGSSTGGLGTGNRAGVGSFAGGVNAGPGAGAGLGRGLGAGLGAGGMPMMPMAPMAGGMGEGDKDRDRSTWLSEDESVWGGDGDVAPAVIE